MTKWDWKQPTQPTTPKPTFKWGQSNGQNNPVSSNINTPQISNPYADALKAINGDNGFKLKPIHYGFGTGAILLIITLLTGGAGDLKEMRSRGDQLSNDRQEIQDRNNALQLSQIEAEQAAVIAEQRYALGCIIVVATSDGNTLVSIIEGEPVKDGKTGGFLPDKSVVCDNRGNTGVIENGVVAHTAYTGNHEKIRAAMERQGWTFTDGTESAETSKPGQGEAFGNDIGG